jgi:spermidine synthase
MALWFEEEQGGQARKFRVERTIYQAVSPFQRIDIVETSALGRMLLLDGLVMCSEGDEFIYHEMMAHVPLFSHPKGRSVLIIGGGDGGTAREVLRHPSVERCTLVEIDGMVVDACKAHFHQTACAFEDPRLTLYVQDGIAFVAQSEERFDLILVDSTDPQGLAAPLFGDEFYRHIFRLLTDDGMVVAQAESAYFQPDQQRAVLARMNSLFPRNYLYQYFNLSYPGNMWGFALGSKGPCPLLDFREVDLNASGMEFRYYSAAIHRASFALPAFQARNVAGLVTRFA